jgi:hypothetical protein
MIWANQAGINLVFGVVREEFIDGSEDPRNAWLGILPINLQKAEGNIAIDRSTFYDLKTINNQIHKMWMVIPFATLPGLPPVPPPATVQAVSGEENRTPTTLTKRLSDLKQAFDSGLLTKEEYESKRKLIINEY